MEKHQSVSIRVLAGTPALRASATSLSLLGMANFRGMAWALGQFNGQCICFASAAIIVIGIIQLLCQLTW